MHHSGPLHEVTKDCFLDTDLVSVLSWYPRRSSRARQTNRTLHSITACRTNWAFLTLNRRNTTNETCNNCSMSLKRAANSKHFKKTHRNTLLSSRSRRPLGAWSARWSNRSSSARLPPFTRRTLEKHKNMLGMIQISAGVQQNSAMG